MIEGLKPLYSRLLTPVAGLCGKANIHPNAITIGGMTLFGAGAYATARGAWPLALALLAIGSLMDGLDGLLARTTGTKSRFGAFLDSTVDRITEILWVAGLLAFYLRHPSFQPWGTWWCFGALTASLMVSYVRARAEGLGIACSRGMLQRPERIIILGISMCFGPRCALWGVAVVTVFSSLTTLQRIYLVYRHAAAVDHPERRI
jgi:CDP-diacylglycerol--glycerol-3-phosphate 3-phosphatidyltransferase